VAQGAAKPVQLPDDQGVAMTMAGFDAYWRFHLAREYRRVHQARYQQPPARAA
jgi:hypothetical protein